MKTFNSFLAAYSFANRRSRAIAVSSAKSTAGGCCYFGFWINRIARIWFNCCRCSAGSSRSSSSRLFGSCRRRFNSWFGDQVSKPRWGLPEFSRVPFIGWLGRVKIPVGVDCQNTQKLLAELVDHRWISIVLSAMLQRTVIYFMKNERYSE